MTNKRIPLKIVRNEAGFGSFDVVDERGEWIASFSTREEAKQYVLTAQPNEDGEYEPDYEWMMESRYGDPDTALDRAEASYERYVGW